MALFALFNNMVTYIVYTSEDTYIILYYMSFLTNHKMVVNHNIIYYSCLSSIQYIKILFITIYIYFQRFIVIYIFLYHFTRNEMSFHTSITIVRIIAIFKIAAILMLPYLMYLHFEIQPPLGVRHMLCFSHHFVSTILNFRNSIANLVSSIILS